MAIRRFCLSAMFFGDALLPAFGAGFDALFFIATWYAYELPIARRCIAFVHLSYIKKIYPVYLLYCNGLGRNGTNWHMHKNAGDSRRGGGVDSGQNQKKHTAAHIECPPCIAMRATPLLCLSLDLPFAEAAKIYKRMRIVDAPMGATTARYITRNTEKAHARYVASLNLFFGEMRLDRIKPEHLRSYQMARVQGAEPFIRRRRPHEEPASCPCKPAQINQELCFLRSVLRRGKAWSDELEEHYEEFREDESEIQRALTPEEQDQWLGVAASQARWSLIHWYSILAFDTTMSTNELRGLRLGDVRLHHQLINVPWPSAKNRYRHRTVAIESAEALWACEQLLRRAHELGAHGPLHYLFPIRRVRDRYDATEPMSGSGLKKLWEEVRVASKLTWFRTYDTRHTGITRQAEHGVPFEIIKARAGHISDRMSSYYTHVSLSAQRQWLGRTPYLPPGTMAGRKPMHRVEWQPKVAAYA